MINRVIHTLSNAAGPFDMFDLPQNPDFIPRRLTKAQALVRSLLFLDRGEYYVNALVCALKAYPDIEAFITDNVASFDPSKRKPNPVSIEGADFLVEKNMQGRWLDNDATLPLNLTYTIRYSTSSLLTIKGEDRGEITALHYTTAGQDPQKILHIDWQDSLPFSGPLRLSQTWTGGSSIVIRVQPRNFPYDSLVRRVIGNPYVNERLHQLLLQEEFFASEDPVERAAILALAIVTDDKTVVQPELPDEHLENMNGIINFRCDSTRITCDSTKVFCDNAS